MAKTLAQLMAMSRADLEVERDRYIISNPEYTRVNNHVIYRDDLIVYADNVKTLALTGPGQNPPGPPPPPPGV